MVFTPRVVNRLDEVSGQRRRLGLPNTAFVGKNAKQRLTEHATKDDWNCVANLAEPARLVPDEMPVRRESL